ncbi:MAG: CCA tRNA nucleotidyltransferase [Clostridia bacterium]|nr:CCA tRNA nucleotidyltransferase [Clostridia bacterium]
MQRIIPKNLIRLAEDCPEPLYAVGGSVRDFLSDFTPQNGARDWDIASTLPAESLVTLATAHGFEAKAVYKNTGTVKLTDGEGNDYEYSRFRSDKYVRGVHVPVDIFFTDDIDLDARRRDFTCNAVYYDIANARYVDPLNGISAIKEKRLATVAPAEKVFGEDGLRLMRLARQSAQLGFSPDAECLAGATKNAALIDDISPERIFAELSSLLFADKKYGVKYGHYRGLELLEQTGVLARILPELTLGKGMAQRADFHKYDVLEHSLRAAMYAEESVRFAALLHDVGKPFCAVRDGNSYAHPEEGERIAGEILSRLKAPKKLIAETQTLVRLHMYDFDCKTKESKLRRFFATNAPTLEKLLLVKQADFSACTDDLSPAPTCVRWKNLLNKMQTEGAPLALKELAVTGKDLLSADIPPAQIAVVLKALLVHAAVHPTDNKKERLCKLAKSYLPHNQK